MAVRIIPPTWATRGSTRAVDREGVVLLEFANANPEPPGAQPQQAGAANRTFNWTNKVTFAVSPQELGVLLTADVAPGQPGVTFIHDPSKLGKSGDAAAMKKLQISAGPTQTDGSVFFSLSAGPARVGVNVTKAELEVLKTVARYAIPRLLGFDAVFGP